MELQAYQEKILSQKARWTTRQEIPLEAEIMIPDYQAPVFKILKTIPILVLLQKHAAGGKLVLEGYIRCEIFYQSEEDGQLCQIEQKCSFSRTVDLPQGLVQDELIQVYGEPEYINCRATHSRRLELRGAYDLGAEVLIMEEQELLASVADSEAQQKLREEEGLTFLPLGDKVITAEEEIALDQPPQTVVEITGSIETRKIKTAQGKALVKGAVKGRIYYRTKEEGKLFCQQTEFPIRQVVEREGIQEESICQGIFSPLGWAMKEGENGKVLLSVTAMLSFRTWHKQRYSFVEDAFFPGWETTAQMSRLRLLQYGQEVRQSLKVQVEAPETAGILLAVLPVVQPPRVEERQGSLRIGGKGTLCWIYQNQQQELQAKEQSFSYQLEESYPGRPEDWLMLGDAQVSSAGGTGGTGGLTGEIELTINGLLMKVPGIQAVAALEKGAPIQPDPDSPAFTIYYGTPGESAFEIARQLGAVPWQLMEYNGLEQDALERPTRLLVPRGL